MKSRDIFYGWVVVACVFVILFVAFGSAYSFTTFFESLQAEFHTSRSSTSFVFAIAGFLFFSLGAVSGLIADRIGSRRVIIFGIFVIGTGLLLASRAAALWQIYTAYGLGIGIGIGAEEEGQKHDPGFFRLCRRHGLVHHVEYTFALGFG